MRSIARTFWIGWLVWLMAAMGRPAAAQSGSAGEIMALVNQVRATYGLTAYTYNSALASAAQNHANWMAATGIYSHVQTYGSTPQGRAESYGYTGWVSENIVGGTGLTPQEGVIWWQNSPVHLAGLVSTRYSEAGVGVATGQGQNFYVLVMGSPGSRNDDPAGAPRQNAQPLVVTPIEISPPDADGSVVHEVQEGQTAWAIAARYNVPLGELLWLNNLSDQPLLHPGDRLTIRLGEGQTPPPTPTPPTTHVVKSGQTLWTIAALYQVTVEDLLWLNNLSADSFLQPGDELQVRLDPSRPRPTPTPQIAHQVQSGETLWGIALRYGLSLEQLLAYNQLDANALLQPGVALYIVNPVQLTPTPTALPPTPLPAAPAPPTPLPTPLVSPSPIPTLWPTPTSSPAATPTEAVTPRFHLGGFLSALGVGATLLTAALVMLRQGRRS